jgi:hypothetical protein
VAIGTDLRTLLAAQSLGLASASAIYTDKTDQNEPMPYLVLTQLNEDPMKTLGGTTGMRNAEFDIDCVASSRVTADSVADAVDSFIKDYSGAAGASTVRAVLLNDRAYDCIPTGQGTENHKFVTTLNFQVQYE